MIDKKDRPSGQLVKKERYQDLEGSELLLGEYTGGKKIIKTFFIRDAQGYGFVPPYPKTKPGPLMIMTSYWADSKATNADFLQMVLTLGWTIYETSLRSSNYKITTLREATEKFVCDIEIGTDTEVRGIIRDEKIVKFGEPIGIARNHAMLLSKGANDSLVIMTQNGSVISDQSIIIPTKYDMEQLSTMTKISHHF